VEKNQKAYTYFLLASLYFTQFLPFAFFITALPVIMRKQGFTLEQIGYLYALGIPYALKFIWAPFIDRGAGNPNHYKKIVFIMTGIYALITLAAVWIKPGDHMMALFALLFVGITALATQDIAVDAIATRILKPEQRGMGNGLQAAGAFVGYFVGGGIMLINYDRLGWEFTIILMAALLLLSLIPLFFLHEPALPVKSRASLKDLWGFFDRKSIYPLIIVAIVAGIPLQAAYHKFRPFLTDAGLSTADIGFYIGLVGMASGILVSLLSGYLMKKIGTYKAFILILIGTLTAFPALILPTLGYTSPAYLWLAVLLGGGFSGAIHASTYALYMNFSRPGREGTDFTLQNAVAFLAGSVFMPSAGALADRLGYTYLYSAAMLAQALLIVFAVIMLIRKKSVSRTSEVETKEIKEAESTVQV